jgi:hypothetical protein
LRSRLALAISALVLVASGCASPAAPAPPGNSAAPPAPSSEGSAAPSCVLDPCSTESPAPSPQVVFLHGAFTGHYSYLGTTADQTVQVEVRWNVGPDDVHDPNAFTFTSGSYTFSASIAGVCGGSLSLDGPLTRQSSQSLIRGKPQDRQDLVNVVMVDKRLTDAGVGLALSSGFQVPNGEAGCDGGLIAAVPGCSLLFLQTAADRLQTDAACTQATITWTGHLDR